MRGRSEGEGVRGVRRELGCEGREEGGCERSEEGGCEGSEEGGCMWIREERVE